MTRRKDPETAIPEETVAEPEPVLANPEMSPAEAGPDQPDAKAPAAVAQPPRRGGVMAPLLGGAIAAAAGFALSHFNAFGLAPADPSAKVTALEQQLETSLAGLESRLTAAETAVDPAIAPLDARVAALETAPEVDLSGLADLDRRLAAIEAMPAGGDASTAALAAKLAELERKLAQQPAAAAIDTAEIEAALARLNEAEAAANARATEAAAQAEATAQARALESLALAIGTGVGFAAELAAVADPSLQETLAPHVAGVATLATLRADFPDAARATLQLARAANPEAGWTARLADFLADQTEARSLTPREGDDPDAILSRAEHALGEGRLADCLTELATLDASVTEPLQGWMARAEARLAVEAALMAAGGL